MPLSKSGKNKSDTRKPQHISLSSHPFEKISLTTFNTRLHLDIINLQEIDVFLKFFPLPLMDTFAEYTNTQFHATQDPSLFKEDSRFWRWYDICAAELYVFLGIVVYLTSHFEHNIDKF